MKDKYILGVGHPAIDRERGFDQISMWREPNDGVPVRLASKIPKSVFCDPDRWRLTLERVWPGSK